ncbi:hypothetical protein Tco_1312678 [Tanacetum coccineum]
MGYSSSIGNGCHRLRGREESVVHFNVGALESVIGSGEETKEAKEPNLQSSHCNQLMFSRRHHGPSDAMHIPSQPFEFLLKETCLILSGGDKHAIYCLASSDHLKMEMEIPSSSNVKLITDCQSKT